MATYRVPTYDSQQVPVQQAPSGRLNVQAPNLGAILGEGIQQVAGAVQQETNRLSQKRLEDFDNKLTSFDLEQRAAVLKLKGQQAFAPNADGTEALAPFRTNRDTFIEETTKDLTPQQRALAKQLADKHGVRVQAEWASHQDRELQDWTKSVALNGVQTQRDAALASLSDPKAFNEALGKMAYHLQEANPGMEVDQLVKERSSGTALDALRALVAGNTVIGPDKQEHLYNHLTAEDRLKADEMASKGNAANLALKAIMEYMPSNPSADFGNQLADSLFPDNPEAHKELVALAHQRYVASKQVGDEFDREKAGDIFYRVSIGKLGTGAARAELASLTGQMSEQTRGQVAEWLASKDKSGRESSAATFDQISAYLEQLEDPALPTYKDSYIKSLIPKLGDKLAQKLLFDAAEIRRSPEKQQQYHTDREQIIYELRNAGAITNLALDKDDRALVDDISYKLKQLQAATKKPWDLDGSKQAIHELVKPITTEKHWWKSDTTQPLFRVMDTTRLPEAFVSNLLQQDRARWNADPQNKGRQYQPPSSADLFRAYYAAKEDGLIAPDGSYTPKTSLTITTPGSQR